MHKVEVRDEDRMFFDDPGVIGSGGNSGFQAINIAAQFGADRILLVGFDMHTANGVHWHGLHGGGLSNPHDPIFAKWRRVLDSSARHLASIGIEVVNGSANSALSGFPKLTIEQTLERWRL